ncbi:MAG TPA: hypothetical protein VJP88_00290 [Caulobacteraceae bacterium]|nr:hypothetical protein [Caulobacteraceae bacterium]
MLAALPSVAFAQQTINVGNNPPASAMAPAMVVGAETCARSAAIAGQGMTWGFAVGAPRPDQDCETRAFARLLHDLGEDRAAILYLGRRRPEIGDAVRDAHQGDQK